MKLIMNRDELNTTDHDFRNSIVSEGPHPVWIFFLENHLGDVLRGLPSDSIKFQAKMTEDLSGQSFRLFGKTISTSLD